MTDIKKTEQAIRDAGIPDSLNRWIGLTPERLAENDLTLKRWSTTMIAMKTNPTVRAPGLKEQQQRNLATAKATGAPKPKPSAKVSDTNPILAEQTEASRLAMPAQAPKPENAAKTKPAAAKAPAKPAKAPKAAPKKAAKNAPAKKVPAAKTEGGVRPGSKLEMVVKLLQRKEGCTTADALKATGWPAISMPQQAKAAGIKLKKAKDGKVTRYWDAEFAPTKA